MLANEHSTGVNLASERSRKKPPEFRQPRTRRSDEEERAAKRRERWRAKYGVNYGAGKHLEPWFVEALELRDRLKREAR
jgi:hypothetical protein